MLSVKPDWDKLKDAVKVGGILLLFAYFFYLPQGKPLGHFTCTRNSDCITGICINGVCRDSVMHCGDGYCSAEESCTSCPEDCGNCKLPDGEECERDSQCNSTECVHNICRPTNPYPGDGWCDEGEDCWTSPRDCGECMWI